MKLNENDIRKIVQEEIRKLQEEHSAEEEESKISHLAYLMLQKIREKFEEYMGDLDEGVEVSEEFELLHDAVSDAWRVADKMLTGGEAKDSLPNIFENNSDCTQEEISNALDVVSRCVMSGKSKRPSSKETDLGVMPRQVSAPPEGTVSKGVKWVKEGKSNE
jgi:hypothetical protein